MSAGSEKRPYRNPNAVRSAARAAEVVQRRAAGQCRQQIADALGISLVTVTKYACRARRIARVPSGRIASETLAQIMEMAAKGGRTPEIAAALGLPTKRVDTARRRRGLIAGAQTQRRFTSAEIETIRLALTTGSVRTLRELAERLGRNAPGVGYHVRKIRPALVDAGLVPPCSCGEPIFHRRVCSAQSGRKRGDAPAIVTTSARKQVRAALLKGARTSHVARELGLTLWQVRHVRNAMDVGELERRRFQMKRRVKARGGRATPVPARHAAGRDPLFARIWGLIPPTTAGALRDDIVQDIYLAVLDGRIEEDDVALYVQSMSNDVYRQFADDDGPASLDAMLGEDGGATLGDLISDDTAVVGLEGLAIGADN